MAAPFLSGLKECLKRTRLCGRIKGVEGTMGGCIDGRIKVWMEARWIRRWTGRFFGGLIYRSKQNSTSLTTAACVNVCVLSRLQPPGRGHCAPCNLCLCVCQCVKISLSLCPCCCDRHIIRVLSWQKAHRQLSDLAHTRTNVHTSDMIDSRFLCPLHLVSRCVLGRQEGRNIISAERTDSDSNTQ